MELGSLADWVSGIATLSATVVSLWLALGGNGNKLFVSVVLDKYNDEEFNVLISKNPNTYICIVEVCVKCGNEKKIISGRDKEIRNENNEYIRYSHGFPFNMFSDNIIQFSLDTDLAEKYRDKNIRIEALDTNGKKHKSKKIKLSDIKPTHNFL